MSYIGNTPGVSSQRVVTEEVVSGSAKSVFTPVGGYSLGYVDVLVNGLEVDSADFTATDGVTVTLAAAAAVGDTVKIKAWLPRGLSDGYLKSETDALLATKLSTSAGAVGTTNLAANAVTLAKMSRSGTAGQILVSGGPSADPSYQNNPPAFTSGTSMLFVQTSAPTAWTKVTTHNDKSLRVVNGTAGSGGTSAFSTVFASRTPGGSVSVSGSVGSTTIDSSQMPSHYHTGGTQRIWDSSGGYYGSTGDVGNVGYPLARYTGSANFRLDYTSYTGGGGSHNHSFSGSGSFSGSAMDFAVQYVDTIIATKD